MRWRLVLGAAVVIAAAVSARGLTFSADPTAHFPRSSPDVAAWLDLSLRFDAFNTLIVGLEEPAAPLTSDGLKRVKRITDRLTALKASGVLAVASVTNVESIREGADGSIETALLIPSIPGDTAALAKTIAADPQVSGALISRDQSGYVIILRADPRRDAGELAAAIRAVVEEERGPLLATFFGAAFFQAVVERGLRSQLGWLVPALLLLLLGVLAVTVRSPRIIASVLLASVLSVVVWLGLVRLAGLVLTPTSITAALFVFVLSMAAFPRSLEASMLGSLAAIGLGAAALMLLPQLVTFGAALALGALAIAVVHLLIFAPLSSPQPLPPAAPRKAGLVLAVIALCGFGLIARQLRFHGTPQTLFSSEDDVGRSLAFFDRRFGGPDFIQVDFRGDLRDPELAARLLRLTDLLEGPHAFADVRAVAPILGFLNHGFGGVHRIPTSRESLNNLWFFLEGRPDVRNLVSDKRDEAMVVLRVPSKLPRPVAELTARVEAAIAGSLETGTTARLTALAGIYALPTTQLAAVLEGPTPDMKAEVEAALRKWLASGDSPYQPTAAQWTQLAAALGDRAKLTAAGSAFPELGDHAEQLADSMLEREKDLRLALHAMALVDRLWPSAPPAARARAQGIFADHLDPHGGSGVGANITVTGLPVVAAQIERDSLSNLWRALALLLAVAGIVRLAVTRQPAVTARALLDASLVAAITFAAGALGLGADPGSAALFLLPPLAAFLVSGSRLPLGFALAIAVSCVPLYFAGALPVSRSAAVLVIGLGAMALLHFSSHRRPSALPAVP